MSIMMLWPILLGVCSELVYQVCAKSTPAEVHPLASLSVTYVVGAAISAVLYYALSKGGSLMREFSHLNWTAFALGAAIVGLELGAIYIYKVGWTVSTGPLVRSVCAMIALTLMGILVFRDALTASKIIGIVLCVVGVIFINK